MNKYLIIGFLVALVSAYYVGYSSRGEHEAEQMSLAIAKAVEEESVEWEAKMSVAITAASRQAEIKTETKIITREVEVYIENTDNHLCYDDAGVMLVREASRVTKAENTTTPN